MPFVQGQLTGRVAYPDLAQASALTGPTQSAIFGFPREPGGQAAG